MLRLTIIKIIWLMDTSRIHYKHYITCTVLLPFYWGNSVLGNTVKETKNKDIYDPWIAIDFQASFLNKIGELSGKNNSNTKSSGMKWDWVNKTIPLWNDN